jgi:hypothetical protein
MPSSEGLCACGCGHQTRLASKTDRSSGRIKDQPMRYLKGHHPHGDGRKAHPLYQVWHGIIQRCVNPRAQGYHNYGGRGIQICERWRASFWAFVGDVGERPSPAHSLDRQDNERGYAPNNVRWATSRQQTRNARYNVPMTAYGTTQIMQAWIEASGLPKSTFFNRLERGWSLERILETPVQQKAADHSLFPADGARFCREHGLHYQTVKSRLYRGLSWEEAIARPVAPQRGRKSA